MNQFANSGMHGNLNCCMKFLMRRMNLNLNDDYFDSIAAQEKTISSIIHQISCLVIRCMYGNGRRFTTLRHSEKGTSKKHNLRWKPEVENNTQIMNEVRPFKLK